MKESILTLGLILAEARPPTKAEIIAAIVLSIVAVILLIVILLVYKKKRNLKGVDSRGNIVIVDNKDVNVSEMKDGKLEGTKDKQKMQKKEKNNNKHKWVIVSDELNKDMK